MTPGTKIPALFLLAAGLSVTGCGAPGNPAKEVPKVNMQEAADRADRILDDTFSAIKPPVNWTHDENTEGSCTVSRRRTVMTVISPERRGNFLGVVESHWQGQGFIRRAAKGGTIPTTFFRTEDGFQLMLVVGVNGQASFEVSTPCVDPSPVAPPKAKTVGPDYAGGEVPGPDVRSDFWSAGTPAPDGPSAIAE